MKLISALNLAARKHLEFTDLQYMLDAACENPNISRVYVDDEVIPSICIMQIKHMIFIGGKFSYELLNYLLDHILNLNLRNSYRVFYIFCGTLEWEKAIRYQLAERCNKYERSLYHIKPTFIEAAPINVTIKEIDSALMNSSINNFDMINEEVLGTATYDSMEDFFLRGIGYTPVIDNKVCGFCTSEYPSKSALAIGIEVLEEYQREGIAKAMTIRFLNKATQRGLNVYWECWKNNIPSIKTALSCGFRKVADYPMLFVDFGLSSNG